MGLENLKSIFSDTEKFNQTDLTNQSSDLGCINQTNKNKSRKKRQELSKSASRGLNKNNVTVRITFD